MAYHKNFTRRQIKSAFERRGYITDKKKRGEAQAAVIDKLQKSVLTPRAGPGASWK